MKELFKNKLFIILSLFIILITFISSNCFASFSITYNNTDYILPDFDYILNELNFETSCYIIGFGDINNDIKNKFKLFIFNSDMNDRDVRIRYYTDAENPLLCPYIYWKGNWVGTTTSGYTYYFDGNNWVQFGDNTTTCYYNDYDFIYSTHDIYNYNNEVVFHPAPLTPVEVEQSQVTIPAIQQVEEIPQGMNQVLQVIIPIGLIVLSIGFVIYLTKLVIYRLK